MTPAARVTPRSQPRKQFFSPMWNKGCQKTLIRGRSEVTVVTGGRCVEILLGVRLFSTVSRNKESQRGHSHLRFRHAIGLARQCRCQDECCSGEKQCVRHVI